MNYYITLASKNSKTGAIPVSTISNETCPTSCPLKGKGCYADGGPLRLHWDKVSNGERGTDFDTFVKQIEVMPANQVWRYAQAGDLPGRGDVIDRDMFRKLVAANNGRPVIAYTHKPPVGKNLDVLQEAVGKGFSVNLSANDLNEADTLLETGLPVVTLLSSEYERKKDEDLSDYTVRMKTLPQTTPKGYKVAVCPATFTDTTCGQCLACAKPDRNCVIGFPAHGNRKSVIDRNLKSSIDHPVVAERTVERDRPALRLQ